MIYSLYTRGVPATGLQISFAKALEDFTWRIDGATSGALTSSVEQEIRTVTGAKAAYRSSHELNSSNMTRLHHRSLACRKGSCRLFRTTRMGLFTGRKKDTRRATDREPFLQPSQARSVHHQCAIREGGRCIKCRPHDMILHLASCGKPRSSSKRRCMVLATNQQRSQTPLSGCLGRQSCYLLEGQDGGVV